MLDFLQRDVKLPHQEILELPKGKGDAEVIALSREKEGNLSDSSGTVGTGLKGFSSKIGSELLLNGPFNRETGKVSLVDQVSSEREVLGPWLPIRPVCSVWRELRQIPWHWEPVGP